jgi:hypothetical protein
MSVVFGQLLWLVIFGLLLAAAVSIAASVRRLNSRFDHVDSGLAEIAKALHTLKDSHMQVRG